VEPEDVRLAVYRTFAATGRAPSTEEIAQQLSGSIDEVGTALLTLASARHLVLDDAGRIVMAHPFTAVPMGFSVMGPDVLWWGGCAWDSFALPHLLPARAPLLVATTCPACDAALAWNVGIEGPPAGDEIAHFLVPAARMWDDVVHTCSHQRIFCSHACVDDWLRRTGNTPGCTMTLATLWQLASGWYAGRLDAGYQRREPAASAQYLRDAGLAGSFWGLPD
jgi:hypothetical protein